MTTDLTAFAETVAVEQLDALEYIDVVEMAEAEGLDLTEEQLIAVYHSVIQTTSITVQSLIV